MCTLFYVPENPSSEHSLRLCSSPSFSNLPLSFSARMLFNLLNGVFLKKNLYENCLKNILIHFF